MLGMNPAMIPPANMGPAVMPQGNPGNAASALVDVQAAIRMLEKSLPLLPMGSPLHAEILSATKSLSKHISPSEGGGGSALEIQSLLEMAKAAEQNSQIQALSKMFPANAAPAVEQTPTEGVENV